MEPLISVIVPVYKVEAYLETCVDSILSQTYPCLQVILVDDGSPDGCGAICDAYARRDARVTVIHKKNGGLSSARNAGLDAASGTYITFTDSDDRIAADMLETLLRIARQENADVVRCNYARFRSDDALPDCADDTDAVRRDTSRGAVRAFLTDPYARRKAFQPTVCPALYRADTIRALRFPEGLLYEDGYYTPQVLVAAETLVHVDRTMYFYRETPNSITSRVLSDKAMQSLDDWEFIYGVIHARYPELAGFAVPKWAAKLFGVYDALIAQDAFDRDGKYKAHIVRKIRENRRLFLSHVSGDLKRKVRLICRSTQRYDREVLHGSFRSRCAGKLRAVLHR